MSDIYGELSRIWAVLSPELESLLDQLTDESRPIRMLDLTPLSDVPRSLAPRFRESWLDLSDRRRLELVTAMVEQAETNIQLNFQTVFRECLSNTDAQVRRLAVEGLWEDERTSLVAPLVALLSTDPAAEVRAAAAASLGRFVLLGELGEIADTCATQAGRGLRAAWGRPGEVNEVRRRALEGLAYLDDASVCDLIDSAYYDEDDLMRQSAVFAMGRSANRRWAKYVLAELDNPAPAMRFEAATAAGELSLTAAIKPLIRLLDDSDGSVSEAAVLALGKIGGADARRAIEACLGSPDEHLAEAAGEALEELTFTCGEDEFDADLEGFWDEDDNEYEEDFDFDAEDAEDEDWDEEDDEGAWDDDKED
jgi:HEAT repeat protein